jgi:hypothetical protein
MVLYAGYRNDRTGEQIISSRPASPLFLYILDEGQAHSKSGRQRIGRDRTGDGKRASKLEVEVSPRSIKYHYSPFASGTCLGD